MGCVCSLVRSEAHPEEAGAAESLRWETLVSGLWELGAVPNLWKYEDQEVRVTCETPEMIPQCTGGDPSAARAWGSSSRSRCDDGPNSLAWTIYIMWNTFSQNSSPFYVFVSDTHIVVWSHACCGWVVTICKKCLQNPGKPLALWILWTWPLTEVLNLGLRTPSTSSAFRKMWSHWCGRKQHPALSTRWVWIPEIELPHGFYQTWVCLKMVSTPKPKPNGIADHYPY